MLLLSILPLGSACSSDGTGATEPGPDISIAVTPASVSIEQGGDAQVTVHLTRTGGAEGAVTLSVTGLPAGVSAEALTIPAGSSEADVALTVSGAAVVGPESALVRAEGPDGLNATATLSVEITESAGTGGGRFTWTFCADVPEWLAVQDGAGGPWVRVMPASGNDFEFEVSSEEVGVAFVLQGALIVQLKGFDELQQVADTYCRDMGSKTLDVVVQGMGPEYYASLALGLSSVGILGTGEYEGTFLKVPAGPVDLFGARSDFDAIQGVQMVNRYYLERDLTPVNGSTLEVDFEGANSVEPVSRTATIMNLGSDEASLHLGLLTPPRTTPLHVVNLGGPSTSTSRTIPLLPGSLQEPGDLHSLYLTAGASVQDPEGARAVNAFFHGVGDQVLPLGPELDAPEVTVAATMPYLRHRVRYERQPEYDGFWAVGFLQLQEGNAVHIFISDGYQQGGVLDITMPDFSGTAGWSDDWALDGSGTIHATFSGFGWDGPLPPPSDGGVMRSAGWVGEIIP